MPVAVRNITKTNVIHSTGEGEHVEWGYAGSPDGSDLQEVPEDLWASARFRRAVNRGVLSEDTKDALDEAYGRQRETLASKEKSRMEEVVGTLEAGQGAPSIVISADDLDSHMHATERRQESHVLEDATEAAVVTADAQTQALRAQVDSQPDPMAVVNAAVGNTQE